MYWPPLAVSVEPVMNPASSETRKATQYAISSGSPSRPSGISGRIFFQGRLRGRLDHFGRDIAWANDIDGDSLARAFLRQRLGEADVARFGGGVVGLSELAFLPVDRRNIDDATEAPLAHALDDRTGHVEERVQVGVDHLKPLLARHLVKCGVACDSRVVDEDVEGTDLLGDLPQTFGAFLIIRHVPFKDRDAGVRPERLGGRVVAVVRRRDAISRRLQGFADGRADPARSTAHHRHSRHVRLPTPALRLVAARRPWWGRVHFFRCNLVPGSGRAGRTLLRRSA